MKRFLFFILFACCLNLYTAFGAEAYPESDSSSIPIEIEGSRGFSDICQQMLGYITGLDCRNAHFYILMDVSGSTKANGVSDSFAKFYSFLNMSFFGPGDKFTYVPFALDVDWSMEKNYDYDPEINPIISPGNLTDDMGTDWYKPIFLLLRKIEQETLKKEMPIVILHLSDRADNDDPRPDAYLRNDFYPKADPGGQREWERLQHVFNAGDKTLRFNAPIDNSATQMETFNLAVWYADNIGDFQINRNLNRERGIEGAEVMLAALQNNREVTFRMREKPSTVGFNLYIADNRDSLIDALNNSAAADKKHVVMYQDIKYEGNPAVPDIKEYKVLNTDLLRTFQDADKSSLYYSIRDIDANYGESQMRFIRELPPIIARVSASPILLTLAILSLLVALLLCFQRINCNLILDGDQKLLLSGGKPVVLKCSRVPSTSKIQAFNTYPPQFDNKNIVKLALNPDMIIPLFKLSVHVSQMKDEAVVTGPKILKDGKNNFSATMDETKMEFSIEKKDIIKKNFGKLVIFFVFLLIGLILLIASAVMS